ncbi:MAG TPA: M48 family metalloprotease, partial [Acidobacteriota bacterium]|nr:M48 family metalloprotease [Acidobacteriota bacterium]
FDNGFRIAMEAVKEMGIVEDPAKVKRLNDIGYKVAQRAAPDMAHFSFRIVKMEEPNAFALPGGFIFVTTGMLDLDLTDDELAALLGHEVTHIKNGHISKMNKRQTLMNLLYQALIIGIAVGVRDEGSGYNPATGMPTRSAKTEILSGSAAFGLIFQELLLRGFSRDLELDADHGGMVAAAGAGFSPAGTPGLFEKMRRRIYEAPGFGYWRTHPYLDDRVGIARSLASTIEKSKNPPDPSEYRGRTQKMFLDLVETQKEEEQKKELRRMALNALRTGDIALKLREDFIQEARQKEEQKEPFFRDYGKLIAYYQDNIEEVKERAPEAEFAKRLAADLEKLHKEKDTIRPQYEEVLMKKNFDTEMLRRFISNFPDSPRIPEVRFRLAENLRVLKKQGEAVSLYLIVVKSADAQWKQKSRDSLKQVLQTVDDLTACYQAAEQSNEDSEIRKMAEERMKVLSQSFTSLQNGYEFRRKYPDSDYEEQVLTQMTKLASGTLQQGKLYQAIGEYQKALDQYNQILRYCSDLPVADQVKDTIVDFRELQGSKG